MQEEESKGTDIVSRRKYQFPSPQVSMGCVLTSCLCSAGCSSSGQDGGVCEHWHRGVSLPGRRRLPFP